MTQIATDGLSKRYGAATVVDNLFVSCHLLSEMEVTADDIVIIARGRPAGRGPLDELRASGAIEVQVRASDDRSAGQRTGGLE